MLEDVVVPERLLDHQQIKVIELAQVIEVSGTIRRVGIAAQQNLRPPLANFREHFHIPARFYLYLDPLVTRGQLSLDLLQQVFVRVLNTYRDSTGDFLESSTEQFPQGLLLCTGIGVPKRVLHGGLRHIVTTHTRHQCRGIFCSCETFSDQRWGQEVTNCRPGGFNPLVAEKWAIAGHALGPTLNSFAMRGDQQNAAPLATAKAGLKKVFQRHAKFADGDGFDLHSYLGLEAGSCSCCLACCQSDSSWSMVA